MRLRSQLITTFLGCGLLPLLVVGGVAYTTASRSMARMEHDGDSGLRKAAEEQMTSLKGLKKQQVLSYFDIVQKMVVNFSENPATIDAMKQFSGGFKTYRDEAKIENMTQARLELSQYYNGEFANEYRKFNGSKSADVHSYVTGLDDESVALQLAYIRQNHNPLGQKHRLDRAPAETTYNTAHETYHPMIRDYLEQFVLYDVFLVDGETGDVVYSVYKEVDYTTNLKNGPLAKSNLGEAFRRVNESNDKRANVLVDFQPYYPSYEAPASFIASPIWDGEKRLGVAIFQIPLDRISQIMADRSGLGETGETILVGSDGLPRSDCYRDMENRTVVNAYRNPAKGKLSCEGSRRALEKGEEGVARYQDYLGNDVIAAYTPIEILGLKWCLLAKKDASEALAAAELMQATSQSASSQLIFWSLGVGVISALTVATVAWLVANQISRPVIAAAAFAKQISAGDLTSTCTIKAKAEVGELIAAMNEMRSSLRTMITKLNGNAGTLSRSSGSLSTTASELAVGADEATNLSTSVTAAAEEMSSNMTSVSASTEEMSQNVRSVAAAIEEMTASIAEVAQNAEKAAGVAQEAAHLTETSNAKVSQLGVAASEIGKVIEVIQDIAEQTNLLALNATIEAARAGDAGKGFAVVATEVKELAKQTANATDDIRSRIEAIQAATTEAIEAIGQIEGVIRNVNDVSRTIASAVEEQRITTMEISRNVAETTTAVDTVSKSISESAMASREITQNMSKVDSAARQTSSGAGHAKDAGDELLELAQELQGLVDQFRLEEAHA